VIGLRPRPVADFYQNVVDALAGLGVDVSISGTPSEVSDPIPFAEDRTHDSYDREWANRFFQVLSRVDIVLKEHRARFLGRSSPVHFFWGTFDLALTRYSGRPATPPPDAGIIYRRSADAEQICAGSGPVTSGTPAGILRVPVSEAGWHRERRGRAWCGRMGCPARGVRAAL
jgi:hypothetical protein